jgi:hypothetical protein
MTPRRRRSPRITDDAIDAALAKAIATPASVEVDGKKVAQRTAADLVELLNYATGPTATAANVLSISRFSPGGSPVD